MSSGRFMHILGGRTKVETSIPLQIASGLQTLNGLQVEGLFRPQFTSSTYQLVETPLHKRRTFVSRKSNSGGSILTF
jgi:hypothetical protein